MARFLGLLHRPGLSWAFGRKRIGQRGGGVPTPALAFGVLQRSGGGASANGGGEPAPCPPSLSCARLAVVMGSRPPLCPVAACCSPAARDASVNRGSARSRPLARRCRLARTWSDRFSRRRMRPPAEGQIPLRRGQRLRPRRARMTTRRAQLSGPERLATEAVGRQTHLQLRPPPRWAAPAAGTVFFEEEAPLPDCRSNRHSAQRWSLNGKEKEGYELIHRAYQHQGGKGKDEQEER